MAILNENPNVLIICSAKLFNKIVFKPCQICQFKKGRATQKLPMNYMNR